MSKGLLVVCYDMQCNELKRYKGLSIKDVKVLEGEGVKDFVTTVLSPQ
jgi:hypothetical protein